MAGIKNFNLDGIAADVQLGKRGGRFAFDDATTTFTFFDKTGATKANVETNDLTVGGNLTVLGDTTTINVETVTVEDNIIEINSGETGAGVTAGTSGIEINRGTELNAQMIWDETSDVIRFQLSDGTLLDVEGNMPVQQAESLYRESDGKIILDGSGAVSTTAEYLDLSTSTDTVTLTSRNEAGTGDVDLVLTTQGNGSVVIASAGDQNSYLGSVDGVDLTMSGGDEGSTTQTGDLKLTGGDGTTVTGGDVVLSGGANGGTVRIDTTVTDVSDTSSNDTVATVKYVKDKVLEVETSFIGGTDTPETYGTIGQMVVVNDTTDGLKFKDIPTAAITDLTDAPGTLGTEGQVLAVNSGATGVEYVTIDTSFIGSDDTPATYGTEGQYLVVNGTADGVEFTDLPSLDKAITDLTDTPVGYGTEGQVLAVNSTLDGFEYVTIDTSTTFLGNEDTPSAFGTEGQILAVNAATNALEFIDLPEVKSSVTDLTDTPAEYGTEGQVLAVNATADGFEYVTIDTSTAFTDLTDSPATLGTAGQVLQVDDLGTGLEFVTLPDPKTSVVELTDTPELIGTEGQVLAVNSTLDGFEYVTIDTATSFIDGTDTPASYGTAGQYLVINDSGDGVEFADLPSLDKAFTDLTDTPAALGTVGQILQVDAQGTGLEFVDNEATITTLTGLTDTPENLGTAGQVLAVTDTGDAVEFIDVADQGLNVVEVADMYSSIATVDASTGAYAIVATPKAFTNTTEVTDHLVVTRMTVKVPTDLDAGVGFKVIVQNDSTQAEDAVIDAGDSTDVTEGVYVIDGIFQNVSFDVLQNVAIALVDDLGDPVAATAGSVTVHTEYKTVFAA